MKADQYFNPRPLFVLEGIWLPKTFARWKKISSQAKMVYACLANYSDGDGLIALHQNKVAKEVGLSLGIVQRAIRKLVEAKLIWVKAPLAKDRFYQETNQYRFLLHPIFNRILHEMTPGAILAPGDSPLLRKGSSIARATHARTKDSFRRFTNLFCKMWKHHYHQKYPFTKKDGVCLHSIFKHLEQDLKKGRQLLHAYFEVNTLFYEGHPATKLKSSLPEFLAKMGKGTTNWKPSLTVTRMANRFVKDYMDITGGIVDRDSLERMLAKVEKVQKACGPQNMRKANSGDVTALEAIMSPGGGPLLHAYVAWVLAQVEGWSKWSGVFTKFEPGREHWKRYIHEVSHIEGRRLTKKDWERLHEAAKGRTG